MGMVVGVVTVHSYGGDHYTTTYIAANLSVASLGTTRDGVKVSRVVKTASLAELGTPGHETVKRGL